MSNHQKQDFQLFLKDLLIVAFMITIEYGFLEYLFDDVYLILIKYLIDIILINVLFVWSVPKIQLWYNTSGLI